MTIFFSRETAGSKVTRNFYYTSFREEITICHFIHNLDEKQGYCPLSEVGGGTSPLSAPVTSLITATLQRYEAGFVINGPAT